MMGENNHGDMQLEEGVPANDTSTPRLNRIASIRLQQALGQSHDKAWTNHNDVSIVLVVFLQITSIIKIE